MKYASRRRKRLPKNYAKSPRSNHAVAVAYLRVSTDEQNLGLEAQRADINKWAEFNSISIAEWFTEKLSGGTALEDRPELLKLFAYIEKNPTDYVVAQKRDRLGRDVMQVALLEHHVRKHKALVVTADDNDLEDKPEKQLMHGMLDLMAQYERALISQRTSAALQAKLARGERLGRKRYVDTIRGRQLLRRLYYLYDVLHMSPDKIRLLLNDEKVPSLNGKRWHEQQIWRLLHDNAQRLELGRYADEKLHWRTEENLVDSRHRSDG